MSVLLLNALVLVLLFYSVQTNSNPEDSLNENRRRHSQEENPFYTRSNNWNPDTIDYRLTRLEIEVREKAEVIHSEVRETNRRLEALERQNAEIQPVLDSLKAELQRFSQQQQQNLQTTYLPVQREDKKLENRIETLTKGVKIMIATMRGLNSDIRHIRSNVSNITNKTGDLLFSNRELLTRQLFNKDIMELKINQPLFATCSPSNLSLTLPKSCRDVQQQQNESGVYKIQPELSIKPIMVFCDMTTEGGGWTVIQRRYSGIQDFYQNWRDYKHGFGNLGGEFWLGLENIHSLTGHDVNELLIELEDFNLQKVYARYGAFGVGSEVEGFPLKLLGGYNGDAGDSLIYHAGSRFSTKDMDQDSWPEGSCAQAHGGGWWYRNCDTSNLNGRYLSGELPDQYIYQGMYWGEFRGAQYSLLKARMLVKPRDQTSPPVFADNTGNITSQQH